MTKCGWCGVELDGGFGYRTIKGTADFHSIQRCELTQLRALRDRLANAKNVYTTEGDRGWDLELWATINQAEELQRKSAPPSPPAG